VLLDGNPVGTVTADGTGQVSATSTIASFPASSRVKILDAGQGTAMIAQTDPLGSGNNGPYQLHSTEPGFSQGSPRGQATLIYDPSAQTVTVTLTASGLTPGPHAAHIHIGSCQSQGPVQYMLQDFIADGNGNVNHETRTVTGVTSVMLNGGWYLNLHQGDMNNIVANGQPTINFRPLLCANI
jgi:Cu/Zn superoxide dismutase